MNPDETTWRELISRHFSETGEEWADVEECTLTDAELLVVFDGGFGAPNGKPFTLWTDKRVYFPVKYDGYESVGSAPRRPNGEATEHVGGG